jgi:CubicO group peptidase (beta-lactamase class C family)
MGSISVVSPESVGMSSDRLARIRPAMQTYVDHHGYAGISTVVARRGHVVHVDHVGWQDREAGIPMAPDTIFRMYSMTKPVICTALMTLFEEGKFSLIDPVAKFIPAFGATKVMSPDGSLVDQNPMRPMQVRDLMSHTSGLSYDFLEDYPVAAQYRAARLMKDPTRSLAAVIDELATLPLAFHPGTSWHYSVGIDVAARLIEVISGQTLGDFLHERLFAPLGMLDTAFGVPESQRHRVSAMYGVPDLLAEGMTWSTEFGHFMAGNIGRRNVDATYPVDAPTTFQRGGYGLFSTADDYMRFALLLLHGRAADGQRIIGRKTLELMHANHLPPALLPYTLGGAPIPGYGFGLGSRVAMDVPATAEAGSVGEFGWAGAAKTYYWVDPREELVGLFLSQFMVAFDNPQSIFRAIAYQAIDDEH